MLESATPSGQHQDIQLVPFTRQHISEQYLAWLNDPFLMRYSQQRHRRHTEQSSKYYLESMQMQGHYFWAAHFIPTGEHVGNLTAYLDKPNGTADLAILIGSKPQSAQNLGFKAWQCAMQLLFLKQCRKICAGTLATNLAMQRIFQKSHMQVEGIFKDQCLIDNMPVNIIKVAKFRGE